ncbi:Deoxynucleotidyltransferase terminal-interacting protein 2 [Nibea albiflora]|uniref:Deoxynucleotidyltransferase terminal-interacting protein 2 n=1 Tax=Nibea albiflora TaxID=240163 RepID=A0ACB7ES54_NIBAL|nr:Deoxynucleotidyltransferase terminal-interacting protein 2 [Nibea albiflora]
MVATRRGVRVYSPSKTNPDQSSDVQATPSTGRRTRSTVKQAESPTQHALVENSSQLEKNEGDYPASPPPSLKRCTRASRLHSPEQPCTPVGSVHEADVSEVESCCSVVSDNELPVTRTRRRRKQPATASQEDQEISEVESCSSAVSASRAGRSSRRSTRRKVIPERSDPLHAEAEDVKVHLVLESESCSSVVSESQRVTRSQRKTARTRSSAKQQTEDSDAESCASSVSGAEVSKSTSRRATRSRKQTGPIPIHLDDASESSLSPAPMGRSRRATRGKATATVDVSEPPSCDSDGFESGPTYSMMNRRRGKTESTGPKAVDSDSDLTDIHSPMGSPCSTRSRGTPCSSRTGSGTSSRGAAASRRLVRDLSIVAEKAVEPDEEDTSLNDSRLESTVIAEDADVTLLEEDESQALEEKEKDAANEPDGVEKGVIVISEESSCASPSPVCADEAVSKPAVTVRFQQEEPCDEHKDEDSTEMETMQETVPSSEPLKPCQSVTVTVCERTPEPTETEEKDEAIEVSDEEAHPPQGDGAVKKHDDLETRPAEEEEMEVGALTVDAQQVVDSSEVQVQSIQVTPSQQHSITVDSGPAQQPKDVIVQKAMTVSLLDSSDDEDDYTEEEEEEQEEEEEEVSEEEKGGCSSKSEAAGPSVDGLFMIDTRPGQEADEHYYKEKPTEEEEEEQNKATKEGSGEQEEQDEEFVDEEGDDDDDEDTSILFSSRNPLLKEMSSRIDPGIRMKELGGLYINFDGSKSKPVSSSLQKLKEKKIQDEVMKKSIIGPDFEKKDAVPPYSESKQALKLKRRVEREKSTGDAWFNMKAPELSQELKGDLQVLKMRGSMDPKRFYKKNDRDGFPKYFQIGTVVDNPVDFYHSRIPKKDRKRTMVEELLADAEFRQNNKKKYQHIVTEKAAQGAGRRNKKKHKFHKK